MDAFKGAPALIRWFYEFAEASKEQWREAGPGTKTAIAGAKTVAASADFFRFMAVVANVSFQLANLKYEVSRTTANLPKVEGDSLTNYAPKVGMYQYYKDAFLSQISNRSRGLIFEGLYGEMANKGIVTVGSRYADDIDGTDIADRIVGQYSRLDNLRAAKMAPTLDYAWNRLQLLGEGMQYTLDTVEAISNEAAYRFVKDNQERIAVTDKDGNRRVGISDEEAEIIARTQLGAPAYRRRGHYGALTNIIFPFSNTIKEGIRGDFEAFSSNKNLYASRVFIGIVVPQIVQAVIESGLFDSEELAELQGGTWSEIMETQSEFTKTTRWTFPLFLNRDDDKGAVFTIPKEQNPAKRMVGAIVRESTLGLIDAAKNGDKEAEEVVKDLVSMSAQVLMDVEGDFPGLSPGLSSLSGLYNIMRGEPGEVASTFQSGGEYFSREEQARMNADDWRKYAERAKGSLRYTADSFALPQISKLIDERQEDFSVLEAWKKLQNPPEDAGLPYFAGYGAQLLKVPLGYGFGGWFKYGDGGIKEKLFHLQEEDARTAAARRMRAERNADKVEDGEDGALEIYDEKDRAALQNEIKRRQYEDLDPHMKRYFRYDSQAQRDYILDRKQRTER
jgi:hypothetical protein